MTSLLPKIVSTTFQVNEQQLRQYLDAVGGGHPVHLSAELARQAGFEDKPLPGVHVQGAALGAFTRLLSHRPIQLLRIASRFLMPVYPGQELELKLDLQPDGMKSTPRYQSGSYCGYCLDHSGRQVLELDLELRVLYLKNEAC